MKVAPGALRSASAAGAALLLLLFGLHELHSGDRSGSDAGGTEMSAPKVYLLATVPRSGNGWIRGLLEGSTGLATSSVFAENGSIYSVHSASHVTPCGWLNMCDRVRPPAAGEPSIVKTHWPFVSDRGLTAIERSRMLTDGRSDWRGDANGTAADYLILPVRNPLDNHAAWVRYSKRRGSTERQELRSFVDAWAEHLSFWLKRGEPATIYRYEDLVDNPSYVLEHLLRASGLWNERNITEFGLLRVASIPRLQSYRRKQVGSNMRVHDDVTHSFLMYSVDDIEWVLQKYRPLLRVVGYDTLYELWLDAKGRPRTEAEMATSIASVMRASRRATARFDPWDARA